MMLLVVALFGLLVPNGLFLCWLFYEYDGLAHVVQNKLALAFIIDAFLAMGLLAYSFAVKTLVNIKCAWFVALSLLG